MKKDPTLERLKKTIDDLVIKHARKEALMIMSLATKEEQKEFFGYYRKNNLNVACMVIDTIKQRLVADKILKQKKSDNFGHPYF
jgi:hypothetical protein